MKDLQTMRLDDWATMKLFCFGPEVMKAIRVCRGITEKYCKDCGTVLSRETLFSQHKAQHLCCPVCDTVVASSVVFCPECGKRLRLRHFALFGAQKE